MTVHEMKNAGDACRSSMCARRANGRKATSPARCIFFCRNCARKRASSTKTKTDRRLLRQRLSREHRLRASSSRKDSDASATCRELAGVEEGEVPNRERRRRRMKVSARQRRGIRAVDRQRGRLRCECHQLRRRRVVALCRRRGHRRALVADVLFFRQGDRRVLLLRHACRLSRQACCADATPSRWSITKSNPPRVDWGLVFVTCTIIGAFIAAWTGGEIRNEWLHPMWVDRFGGQHLLRAHCRLARRRVHGLRCAARGRLHQRPRHQRHAPTQRRLMAYRRRLVRSAASPPRCCFTPSYDRTRQSRQGIERAATARRAARSS